MSIDSRFEKFMLSLPSIESIDSNKLVEELEKEKKADFWEWEGKSFLNKNV